MSADSLQVSMGSEPAIATSKAGNQSPWQSTRLTVRYSLMARVASARGAGRDGKARTCSCCFNSSAHCCFHSAAFFLNSATAASCKYHSHLKHFLITSILWFIERKLSATIDTWRRHKSRWQEDCAQAASEEHQSAAVAEQIRPLKLAAAPYCTHSFQFHCHPLRPSVVVA